MAADIVPAGTAPAVSAQIDIDAPPPEGLKVKRFTWGAIYTGTRDALIAAGFAAEGMFPGDPGRGKTSATYKQEGTSASRCIRRKGRTLFDFWVNLSAEECTQRRAAEQRAEIERKKAADFAKAAADAEAALKEQPATEDEFRAVAKQMLWRLWTGFLLVYGRRDVPNESGFRFDAATMDTLEGYISAACWAVESDGLVVFDETVRMKKVREARAAAARHDAPVQRLLKRVAADAARCRAGGAAG